MGKLHAIKGIKCHCIASYAFSLKPWWFLGPRIICLVRVAAVSYCPSGRHCHGSSPTWWPTCLQHLTFIWPPVPGPRSDSAPLGRQACSSPLSASCHRAPSCRWNGLMTVVMGMLYAQHLYGCCTGQHIWARTFSLPARTAWWLVH